LIRGEFDIHTQVAENIYDGLTRLRVERIDEAGNEKLNDGHDFVYFIS
jgi:hypothetical protein